METTDIFQDEPKPCDIITMKAESNEVGDVNNGTHVAEYETLIQYGVNEKVANKLVEIYKSGKLAHVELDIRALDALKEFSVDGAINVLAQFSESNLEHVSNKSAFLCGIMKTYTQKTRVNQGVAVPVTMPYIKGPDEKKIQKILNRTGYSLDVTTGQRKYGGPPPGWEGPSPGPGSEVFCGKIPRDVYEDELIPLFEKCGIIWDLRLMMDPMTGANRGFAFVTFTNREAAQNAVKELDNYEIKPGKIVKINISVPNLRLFVGNIPKSRGKEEIMEEFGKLTAGLVEVIVYSSPDDKKKNRGFCFLEYESHKTASLAKRRLGTGRIKVWGCDIIVDWADPQEEPDQQIMNKVKVLYVRNLTQDTTEEKLKECFEQYGRIERVKKIKDYAFVHFEDRDNAVRAMKELDGREMCGSEIEVTLAKPPSDKKKKEEILRAREKRMMMMLHGRAGATPQAQTGIIGTPPPRNMTGPRAATMRGTMGRGDYDYDYDYYGFEPRRLSTYTDPYYDDYYRYDDFYVDYSPRQGRNAVRPPSTRGTRDIMPRGRSGGPQSVRQESVGRSSASAGRPITTQGTSRPRVKASLSGEDASKRKFDGVAQQLDSKRRFGCGWESQPIAGEHQWYTAEYPSW